MEPVLTLADLDSWSFQGTALAVLGHPIKHSISPPMHQAALARMAETDGRFAHWRYFRFEVPPADLAVALDRLHVAGFRGLNLTVPHKVLACNTVAQIDPAARSIGAVNTLRRIPGGWHGFNTDGYGLATAVQESLGISLAHTPIILLGAGGAARGAGVECLHQGCASLHIANRTADRREALLHRLRPLAGSIPVAGFPPTRPPADLPADALVINATSAGLRPADPPPIDLSRLPRLRGVFDMIYNPGQTKLIATAATANLPHANGLSMLVHQGVRSLEIWSEAAVPVAAMQEAVAAMG